MWVLWLGLGALVGAMVARWPSWRPTPSDIFLLARPEVYEADWWPVPMACWAHGGEFADGNLVFKAVVSTADQSQVVLVCVGCRDAPSRWLLRGRMLHRALQRRAQEVQAAGPPAGEHDMHKE